MSDQACLSAIVHGRVQGVFFRAFVSRQARALGLTGYVRNLPKGAVEVHAEGARNQLRRLLDQLEVGPPGAKVEKVEANWFEYSGSFSSFEIKY